MTTALEWEPTLSWACQDCFDFLGHRVLVRTNSAEFGGMVRRLLRSFPRLDADSAAPELTLSAVLAASGEGGPIPLHALYRDGELVSKIDSRWKLLRLLEWKIDAYLTEHVEDYLIVHAGAVANGAAGMLFPGPSKSGKSSLTLALVLRGFRYLSDEVGLVAASSSELHAFPRPVTCRNVALFTELDGRQDVWFGPERAAARDVEPAEGGYRPVWYAHPEDVRAGSMAEPTPIKYVIFPSRDPEASPSLRPLSGAQAMRQLLKNAVNFPRIGEGGLRLVAGVLEGAQCYSLSANGIQATSKLITDLVGGKAA